MVGQEVSWMTGENVQKVIVAVVVATALQTCGNGESSCATPSKSGQPGDDRAGSGLKYDLQFLLIKVQSYLWGMFQAFLMMR